MFTIRNVCSTAKVRYSKKEDDKQKSVQIETFLYQRKKGSSHLRKILLKENQQSIPHNINKFARNMDIVITGEQSKMLNELWTNNIFSNQDKMFLFKLYNNTLGYNNAVAHFVAGHSPYCTFCDITLEQEQNPETPLHLFFECNSVNVLISNLFRKITGNNDFNVNRREFFGSFERRTFTYPMNKSLTFFSKFLMKYIWECKGKNVIPNSDQGWESICDKIISAGTAGRKFKKMWASAGLLNFDLQPHGP
jgi:hypothetical protein